MRVGEGALSVEGRTAAAPLASDGGSRDNITEAAAAVDLKVEQLRAEMRAEMHEAKELLAALASRPQAEGLP
eukprot:SAG11_NODE_8658_length_990_cov_1.271605_1_plen_72_part_00